MKLKFIESISIKALMIFSLIIIGAITILLSVISSEQFKTAAIDSQKQTLSRILEVSAIETIRQMHSKALDMGNNTKKSSNFRRFSKQILSGSDAETTNEFISLLNDQFHQYYVTVGHLDLQKIRIYSIDFNLITQSSEGNKNLSSQLPDFLLEIARSRSGVQRLKAIGGIWQHENQPLYSVLLPLGGLRLSGYIEFVISPILNLYNIHQMLQAPVAIFDVKGKNLKQTGNWSSSENENSLTISYALTDINDVNIVHLQAREDVEYLFKSVTNSQTFTIFGFVLLMVSAIIILLFVLNHFLFNPISILINHMKHVADGDLTIKINSHGLRDICILSSELAKLTNSLRDEVAQISETAESVGLSTDKVNTITQQTSQGILRQQTETDLVATAINQMSATVQEVASNASDAETAANNADKEATNGTKVVGDTINSINNLASEVERSANVIHKLEQDAEKINDIVGVIRGIAEQTNLLALNAAIEAARAGEQGRGFAVVADEVRTLASRTQQSTREIQEMIETLQQGTREAVTVMNANQEKAQETVSFASKTSDSLTAITSAVKIINDMNTQIAAAAEQQSVVADEINKNIINITQVAEQSTSGIEQTELASNELTSYAGKLLELVQRFKV